MQNKDCLLKIVGYAHLMWCVDQKKPLPSNVKLNNEFGCECHGQSWWCDGGISSYSHGDTITYMDGVLSHSGVGYYIPDPNDNYKCGYPRVTEVK